LYTAIADTLNEEDFSPNFLDTLFTELKVDGLFTRAHDVLEGTVLCNEAAGSLMVDIFATDIFIPESK
jgi:hypothetical protein